MEERRAILAAIEDEGQAALVLAYFAAAQVELDPDLLRAARRRALLLLAAGGDPRRELELGGRAVTALAADLDAGAARSQLAAALASLRPEVDALPAASAALERLLGDPELAWLTLAGALLAEEFADED